MLPRTSQTDWLSAANWPSSGPQARRAELARAATLRLPESPERMICIAGTAQPTVTGASVLNDELRYTLTAHGDGTVPVESAALPGHTCRYARLAHSELPRDAGVAAAVAELLTEGRTALLDAEEPQPETPMPALAVTDGELRKLFTTKLVWQELSAEERRGWLDSLNAPLLPLA